MLHGLSRGSFSFVALLVINPIVILFYQNCSIAPLGQDRDHYVQQARISTPLRDQYLSQEPAQQMEARIPASQVEAHDKKPCQSDHHDCSHGTE